MVVPTLAAWRTATGQDANSFIGDPQFIAPNGSQRRSIFIFIRQIRLRLNREGLSSAPLRMTMTGKPRRRLSPTDVGADAGNFVALDVSAPSIAYAPLAIRPALPTGPGADDYRCDRGCIRQRICRASTSRNRRRRMFQLQCALTGGTAQNGTYNCTIDYSLVGGGSVAANESFSTSSSHRIRLAISARPIQAPPARRQQLTFGGTPNQYTILPVSRGSIKCRRGR